MKPLFRTLIGAACACAALHAAAGTVNLTQWAYGASQSAGSMAVTMQQTGTPTFPYNNVLAGAFRGTVSGFTGGDAWVNTSTNDFVTYCVEFTQSFSLGGIGNIAFSLVAGDSYAHWAAGDRAAISSRLGSLLTFVSELKNPVDTGFEAAAVQLAIWEVIYEKPFGENLSLAEGNLREPRSANGSNPGNGLRAMADSLLTESAATASLYDVFVLTSGSSQDFIALKLKPEPEIEPELEPLGGSVPEPTGLALSALALAAAGAATRRRRAAA